MLALLVAILAFAAPAAPAKDPQAVEIDGARWREMMETAAAGREKPPPGPWAADRAVTLELAPDGLLIRGRWTIRTLRPGWFLGDLLGPGIEVREATWDRKPAGLITTREGTMVAGYVRGDVVLELVAFVPGDPGQAPMTLGLLPAVRGAVSLPAGHDDERFDLRVASDGPAPPRRDRQVFTGDGEVILQRITRPQATTESLVTASTGLGLTFGDAELRGRAHVTYQVRRGQLDAVVMRAPGLSADLTITGPGIRGWRREGDRILVDLQAPIRDRLDLELAWTQAIASATESSMPVPQIEPEGVFRANVALQLARDGEVEVLPELGGWTAVASADLPAWSQGLVEGTPTAAFTASENQGGRLGLLRFVPVEGPPVVVDVADYTIATSHEGRVLMQAHYEVRNERASHLKITPPAGMKILGARVAGDTALPARAEGGAWLIPLRRSLETVKGSLSFPVEVTLMGGDEKAWRRRESRTLGLPRVNAPIATIRTTLHLPPGFTSRRLPGEGDVVGEFTRGEGITYGLAYADPSLLAEADNRFQSAVSSWLSNDFDAAQQELDNLRSIGASNENIARLQANLDVIQGKGKDGAKSSGADAAAERRIKDQAKARAIAEIRAQDELEKQAEAYSQSGDYERAEKEYTKAIEIGEKLALLEQSESVEQQAKNESIASKFKSVRESKKKKKDEAEAQTQIAGKSSKAYRGSFGSASPPRAPQPDPSPPAVAGLPAAGSDGAGAGGNVVYDFDDDPIDGLDLRPGGAAIASRSAANRGPIAGDGPAGPDKVAALTETNIPVDASSRDFTAVVEVTPTASSDAAGIILAGTTAPESRYILDGANVSAPAFGTTGTTIVQESAKSTIVRDDSLMDDGPTEEMVPNTVSRSYESPLRRKTARDERRERRASRVTRQDLDTKQASGRRRSDTGPATTAAPAPPPPAPPPRSAPEMPADPAAIDGTSETPVNAKTPPPEWDGDSTFDFEDVDGAPDETGSVQGSAHDLGRLAAPTSTASALSVVIPAAGEAVLYQRLLLAADAPYVLEIAAREPLRPRKRR